MVAFDPSRYLYHHQRNRYQFSRRCAAQTHGPLFKKGNGTGVGNFLHNRSGNDGYGDRMNSLDISARLSQKLVPLTDHGKVALRGGTLIDGTGAPAFCDATVVIEGERITAVGSVHDTPLPADARVI